MPLAEPDFAALAMEHLGALRGLARRLSGDPGRAEDLVQETYLRALKARQNFRMEHYGIRPWLMRILHNLHVTRAMREAQQPAAMDDETLATVAYGGHQRSVEMDGFEGMDEELVWAIEALPEPYRIVLLLWAIENFTYAEIAKSLSLPVGTVMSRLHRARKQLSRQLRNFATEHRLGSQC
jgi:RNA polymerase sigma-70 factor (ECF subfamily)